MKYLDCGCAITDNGRAWCPSCEAAVPQEAREGEPHGVEARDALGVEKLMSELARIARLFRSASELGSAVLVPIAADIDNARATIKALAAARPAPETREPEVLGYVVGMDNLPARIWLQRDTHGEVTWCSERINDDDVEYIRAPESGEPSGADAAVREAWRSVTDSLPKPGAYVLVGYRNRAGHWRVVRAVYAAARSVVCACEFGGDCLCEMDDTGESWWPEGWYEIADNADDVNTWRIRGTVTHWMPLPERPTTTGRAPDTQTEGDDAE